MTTHVITHAPRAQRGRTVVFVLLLVVALAAGVGLWAGQRYFGGDARGGAPESLRNTLVYPQPRELPAFELTAPDGTPLTAQSLQGRWTLVFVGFTHCPDVCPTTLAQLAQADQRWDALPQAQQPRVLFVSVDPERDTAERAGEYARFFDPDFVAATGDHAALEPFARNLGMVYMRTPLENGGYTVDHSASIAVLDPQGRLAAVVRPPIDTDDLVADIQTLVTRG